LAGRRIAMIAKTFLLAKTFRAYGTNFFRQEKSLRDQSHSAKWHWVLAGG
jgi:hypothetical protein